MNGLAQAVALISALVYIAAAPLELFFFGSPRVRALLHVEADNVADVRMWAFCIGFRNLLAGIGAIVGLVILWTGDEAVGRANPGNRVLRSATSLRCGSSGCNRRR